MPECAGTAHTCPERHKESRRGGAPPYKGFISVLNVAPTAASRHHQRRMTQIYCLTWHVCVHCRRPSIGAGRKITIFHPFGPVTRTATGGRDDLVLMRFL